MFLKNILRFNVRFKSSTNIFFNPLGLNVNYIHSQRCLSYPRKSSTSKIKTGDEVKVPLPVAGKYKVFDDHDASIIQNTSEEIFMDTSQEFDDYDAFEGLNLQRGLTGVYDIHELVDILKRENAQNVFVAAVPSQMQYVEYICVVTGKGTKHNLAMAEFIKKLFKRKRNESDLIPAIEGKTAKNWIALDLGNIALHIFDEETREIYDLETLWSVGYDYDPKCVRHEDQLVDILERHDIFLHDLKPKT